MTERVLIVGQAAPEHVGAAFLSAARSLSIDATLADSTAAWAGGKLRQRLSFRLLGKRPTALGTFSRRVVELCREVRPSVLLSTGVAPVTHDALRAIGKLGVRRINYLTDDPWNPATGARYFWKSLREYDTIYSPRHANMNDLRAHGCGDVRFMPWAYNPELHFPETAQNDAERARYACDVAFVGGGDAGRVELVRPILRSGLSTFLYGGYWERFADTRAHFKGRVTGRELRLAVAGGCVNLCMGRAANRDGHAMRTFELPAMGACMIVEDTAEHRDIFGSDGECVLYYRTPDDIIAHTRVMRDDPERRRALAAASTARICTGQHTYAARLTEMLRG